MEFSFKTACFCKACKLRTIVGCLLYSACIINDVQEFGYVDDLYEKIS